MKDNFSTQSKQYFQFRPGYPPGLYEFLKGLLPQRDTAWDCGTGNGQVAVELAKFIQNVYATDISRQQLENSVPGENIFYSLQPAENTSFENNSFDLITVAQAIHWFDFDKFYMEVCRVLKPGGILAVMGYSLMKINENTNKVIRHFYEEIIGQYWDKERKYLDRKYKNIPFPLREIAAPEFENTLECDFEHLTGYLKTWSAVKHYQKKNGQNPVDLIAGDLRKTFGERGVVTFPVLLRVGMLP